MGIDNGTIAGADSANRIRRRLISWFCFAFVAVNLLVPVYRLTLPPNQPFGWQMYSSLAGHTFEVKFPEGTSRVVDARDYVLRYRSEIDFRDYLPPVLCREFPDATEVTAFNPVVPKAIEKFPCDR